MIRAAQAAASQHVAAEAALATLAGGAGAADAVIAGFFAAAGANPGVLFAPTAALLGGFGGGGRAFDGRAVQPGKGAPRPRGFVAGATIPPGARVAVPRSIAMLALLHSYRGRSTFLGLARAGVAAAEAAGAKARASLIRKVGSAGLLSLRAPEVVRALISVGGNVVGGALTEADLEAVAPVEADAVAAVAGEGIQAITSPFAASEDQEDRGDAEVIVACDGRGVIAALSYVPARDGITVPELEVTVARSAVPVMRGVTRLAPGTPLPAPAPIGIVAQAGGFSAALGLPGQRTVEATTLAELVKGASAENALAAVREKLGGRGAALVVTDGKVARAISG